MYDIANARRVGQLVFPRGGDLHAQAEIVAARTITQAEDEALEASRLQLRDHPNLAARATALRHARA